MTAITIPILAGAIKRVKRMTFKQREQLADEIHAAQPNLLYSVVALNNQGAPLELIEVVLNLLLVFYEAMKTSGRTWPVISEDEQECSLQIVVARIRSTEGLAPDLRTTSISDAMSFHPEAPMLACTFENFREHGLLGVETEAVKFAMLVALNLVECIARTAPHAGHSATTPSA